MKHPAMYYVYYACGWLFVGTMAVVVYHMLLLWLIASHV